MNLRKVPLLPVLVLLTSLVQGVWSIYQYGYMGQDFQNHLQKATASFAAFNFVSPNSPFFYWLPNTFYMIFGPYFLEVQGLFFLLFNLAALWFFYLILCQLVSDQWLRLATFLIIVFLPARVIHSLVFAADAMTVLPVFVIVWAILNGLLGNVSSERWKKAWTIIAWAMLFVVAMKYSFIAMVPVLAAVGWKLKPKREFFKPVIVALAPTVVLFLFMMVASYKVDSYTTTTHWRSLDKPMAMNLGDIFLLNKNDPLLFQAPDYFDYQNKKLEDHQFSYLALLHSATFMDTRNFFQAVPSNIPVNFGERIQAKFPKERTLAAADLSSVSLLLAIPLTLLALCSALFFLYKGLQAFQPRSPVQLEAPAILCLIAVSVHFIMVASFPFLAEPYKFGYWRPRYIIPSLMIYILLAAVFMDGFARKRKNIGLVCLGYGLALTFLFIVIL